MIEWLFESAKLPRGPARIHQRIANHISERFLADMMRTGKRRQNSIAREQFESAHMQLLVTTDRIMQPAFGFRE